MKAIVNIGLRKVEITYSIKPKDRVKLNHNEMVETFGKDWELFQKNQKSNIQCKQIIWFKDMDEWKSIPLFDGRMIDFHYDYENRKEFKTKKDWGGYVFQGYGYTDGQPQLYNKNVVTQVVMNF
jgi:ABC-type Zn2+ transport system substrate-binding protein/surface adhesin